MNDHIIDLTHSLQTGNDNNGSERGSLHEMVIETLEKFDVNFDEIRKEVNVLDFMLSESREKDKSIFGEYDSVSYKTVFVTYNVKFLVRLLTFQKDNKFQVLKLDIQPNATNIKKELEYCCNSLQRRRNLNLMFKTLITFARFIESRRLICDLILKKNRNIKIEHNKDGGIIIVYSDDIRNVKLGIFWSIACNSVHEISDVVEVYYKVVELPNRSDIVDKLTILTSPSLDFTKKYHLWKLLIDDLSEKALCIMIDKMPETSTATTSTLNNQTNRKRTASKVNVSSDSEETSERSLVLDKMSPSSSEATVNSVSQKNLEKEAEGVTILSSDSEDVPEKELNSPINLCYHLQGSSVIVHASSSEKLIEKLKNNNQSSTVQTDILNSEKTKEKELISKRNEDKQSESSLSGSLDLEPEDSTFKKNKKSKNKEDESVTTDCSYLKDLTKKRNGEPATTVTDDQEVLEVDMDSSVSVVGLATVSTLRKSSRNGSVLHAQKESISLSPKSHLFLRTHENSVALGPSNSSGQSTTDCTSPKIVHVNLVSEEPVSSSPDFLEHNLMIPPPKIRKISDEDLEITSVTYIVPE